MCLGIRCSENTGSGFFFASSSLSLSESDRSEEEPVLSDEIEDDLDEDEDEDETVTLLSSSSCIDASGASAFSLVCTIFLGEGDGELTSDESGDNDWPVLILGRWCCW